MPTSNLFEVKQQLKKKHFESVFDGLMVEQMFWRQTIKPLRQRTNFFRVGIRTKVTTATFFDSRKIKQENKTRCKT